MAKLTIDHIIRFGRGEIGTRSVRSLLKARDRRLRLELESAHYLHHMTEHLADVFPRASFILTVRDPRSWLESEINQELATRRPHWAAIAEFRYGRYGFPKETQLPSSERIYSLSAYLQYWADHVKRVISSVPQDRLLVLDVGAIKFSAQVIADFFGIDSARIAVDQGHAASLGTKTMRLLDMFESRYLDGLIEKHCADSLRLLAGAGRPRRRLLSQPAV